MRICGYATGINPDGTTFPIPVDADLQVEHDGLRLGVCLAIAERLEKYPGRTHPELRTGLTPAQRSAVDQYRAERSGS